MVNKDRTGPNGKFHPKNKCEYKGCSETNTEVEIVAGHPLSLCEIHGPENGSILTTISREKMKKWAKEHLKSQSAKKFQ